MSRARQAVSWADIRAIRNGHRCVALDHDAKRCGRTATWASSYHGDDELYGFRLGESRVGWVVVEFCDEHARATWPHEDWRA